MQKSIKIQLTRGWLLPFVVSTAVYLILAGLSIRKPMAGDEIYCLEEIRAYTHGTFQKIGILGQDISYTHVPFYPVAISFLLRPFGESLFLIRAIGILIGFTVLFLISFFPFRILPDPGWAKRVSWIGSLIVATHPVLIQGSAILDYDATFFLLFVSLFCFFWLESSLSMRSLGGLSFLWGLCLWVRSGSALILPVSWAVWVVLMKPGKKEAVSLGAVFLGGGFLFALSWGLFVFFVWGPAHFFGPFAYLFDRVGGGGDFSSYSLQDRTQDFARFLLWLGIPWLLLLGAGFVKKIPQSLSHYGSRIHFLRVVLFFGIPVYHVLGRSSWGYPKYIAPFVPLATFLFTVLATERWPSFGEKERRRLFFLAGVIVFSSFLLIGDPLYQLCYSLKKSLMVGSSLSKEFPTLMVIFGLPLCVVFFFAFVVRRGVKPRIALLPASLLGSLFALFSTQIPFATVQAYAPYPTTSIYGDEQRNRVVEILKKEVRPEELILAPELIIPYEAGVSLSDRYEGKSRWQDPEVFLQFLKRESPKAVVYSVSTLSIRSYQKVVQNEKVQEALRSEFFPSTFGDYTLWLKKESPFP